MKGFTLIELLIVVSIISVLTLFGSIKFNSLKSETLINSETEKFVSSVKSARSMSISGEIKEGETLTDFEESGIPKYGVSVSGNSYNLFREYTAKGAGSVTHEDITSVNLSPELSFHEAKTVTFERMTGKNPSTLFIIERTGSTDLRNISINDQGVVDVTKS